MSQSIGITMAAYLLFHFGFILIGTTTTIQSEDTSDLSQYWIEYFQRIQHNADHFTPLRNEDFTISVKKPYVELYYECMCPGCRKFDTTYFSEVVHKLRDHIIVRTIPYGKASTTTYYNGTITFWCQHGEPECHGNKIHACANCILTKLDESVLFNSCLMELDRSGNGSDDKAVDVCASKMNITNKVVNSIKRCANGEKGSELLREYGEVSLNAKYTSLPHLVIDSRHWTGNPENLMNDICDSLEESPEVCKDKK